jgi:hypothetical protein
MVLYDDIVMIYDDIVMIYDDIVMIYDDIVMMIYDIPARNVKISNSILNTKYNVRRGARKKENESIVKQIVIFFLYTFLKHS